MPRRWSETVQSHRRGTREAVLDAAWTLVVERGVTALTMSQIAQAAGIGRATLYKYFSDAEAVLIAWHERHVATHLERLEHLPRTADEPIARLEAVLTAYADVRSADGGLAPDLHALLHRDAHIDSAERQLATLITQLLADVADVGRLRTDVPREELSWFCLRALAAAGDTPPGAGTERLVALVLDSVVTTSPQGTRSSPTT